MNLTELRFDILYYLYKLNQTEKRENGFIIDFFKENRSDLSDHKIYRELDYLITRNCISHGTVVGKHRVGSKIIADGIDIIDDIIEETLTESKK